MNMAQPQNTSLTCASNTQAGVEAFFSRAIVGGPMSLELGVHTRPSNLKRIGVEIAPVTMAQRLSDNLLDSVAIDHAQIGKPRRKASRMRRGLERFSLPIAMTGLVLCITSLLLLKLG